MEKTIAEWHEEIEAALTKKPQSAIIPRTVNSAMPPTGSAKVGTVKTTRNHLGEDIVWKMQSNGVWTRIQDKENTSGDDGKETMSENEVEKPITTVASLIPNADVYLDNGFNLLLIGLHGTGKTESIKQLAKERDLKLKYYSCSTLDPYTDLVGVPVPRFNCPEHGDFDSPAAHVTTHPDCDHKELVQVLRSIRPQDVDEAEMIFFDEFNRADPKTLNAIFEIIQFRSINGEPLPNLRVCWAAMNPPDEDYEVEKLDPALVDRFDVYITVDAKPSVAYMTQFMEKPIAQALHIWWNEHSRSIESGQRDRRTDYISPRRLLKIGLVWKATKSPRAVGQAMPIGGNFETNKLKELLKSAQQTVDDEANGIVRTPTVTDAGLGDSAAPQFIYQPSNIRTRREEIADFLRKNPTNLETQKRIIGALKQGIGGEELVIKYGPVLDALNPSTLESFVTSFPAAKQTGMRNGFIKLYQDSPDEAKKLERLHSVLKTGARGTTDFPITL
jgi:hypothetical protein